MSEPLRLRLTRPPSGVRVLEAGTPALGALAERAAAERAERARAEGLREGRRAALEEAAGALAAAAERLDAAREEAAAALAETAVALALDIGRQLACAAIEAGEHDLERMVRETLSLVNEGRGAPCVVHLSPADAELARGLSLRAGTEVASDLEVPRGHVHVSTPKGVLVRDPEEALATIAERIWGELR